MACSAKDKNRTLGHNQLHALILAGAMCVSSTEASINIPWHPQHLVSGEIHINIVLAGAKCKPSCYYRPPPSPPVVSAAPAGKKKL